MNKLINAIFVSALFIAGFALAEKINPAPNLIVLLNNVPETKEWQKQWEAAPGQAMSPLAEAGITIAQKLTRPQQVEQALNDKIGGTRKDTALAMDVARHEAIKFAVQSAIASANAELKTNGQQPIKDVMITNCSPLGNGTRDGDLTIRAEDETREEVLFRHLASFFGGKELKTTAQGRNKYGGPGFGVDAMEITFHRGSNEPPQPHVPTDLMNFALSYRKNIERQFDNPEAYLGFGFEEEVQGRQSLRIAGKNGPQVLIQTFSVKNGNISYEGNRVTNQKQALDMLRSRMGPDWTRAHDAMHVFCDFVQASHHQNDLDMTIDKGPLKYSKRALDAFCRLYGFPEWNTLSEASQIQLMRMAVGPGMNHEQITMVTRQLNSRFADMAGSKQKIANSDESSLAMSMLRRAATRGLQEVALVMMDPPPARPAHIDLERWNGLNRAEQESIAQQDPAYKQRLSAAAMENLVIATRLLAQIDMEGSKHGAPSPFGIMALRQVICEAEGNPRMQRVLQLAADHAVADAAVNRTRPAGVDVDTWLKQRRETIKQRDKLRYQLSQECLAYREDPAIVAVEKIKQGNPNDMLKKCPNSLIPPDLEGLNGKRLEHLKTAMGGDDPSWVLTQAKNIGKGAAAWTVATVSDPGNINDMLSLVAMYQEGAGTKDYARFFISNAAGRYNPILGYATGITEISMINDPAAQDKALTEMGKGVIFDILSRLIPGCAQAKLFFDIEKGMVNVTYGYAIRQLNSELVDAMYLGEAGRTGPGRGGTLGGWVRDAVEAVVPENCVRKEPDEAGKVHVFVDCVKLYQDHFVIWTNQEFDEIERSTPIPKKQVRDLINAHDRLVKLLKARSEGMEPSWYTEYSVGLYMESDLDAAMAQLMAALDPFARVLVTRTLDSVPNVREYIEERNGKKVNVIEEGLVGRFSGDFIAGIQSYWNTRFMKIRELKRNIDGLETTAITQAIGKELTNPQMRIVPGKLPGFALDVFAYRPEPSLAWEFDGNVPLPLCAKLEAAGPMPDDAPKLRYTFTTGPMTPAAKDYRPYKNVPATTDARFLENAQKDPAFWSANVFRQPITVQAIAMNSGQVLAEKKIEIFVRFAPQAKLAIEPKRGNGFANDNVTLTAKGEIIPARARFEWEMGDGNTQSTDTPTLIYSYRTSGDYNVKLRLYKGRSSNPFGDDEVYLGGAKEPILGEASSTVHIEKDNRKKHYIEYVWNNPKQVSREYWYYLDDKGRHVMDGEERRWYEDGKLALLITYKMGVPNGPAERYYANGNPEQKGVASNGKMEGPAVSFHENGKKSEEGACADDVKIGTWKYYDDQGRTWKIENRNAKGELDGESREWSTLAATDTMYLSRVSQYKDDKCIHMTTYREDGTVDRSY